MVVLVNVRELRLQEAYLKRPQQNNAIERDCGERALLVVVLIELSLNVVKYRIELTRCDVRQFGSAVAQASDDCINTLVVYVFQTYNPMEAVRDQTFDYWCILLIHER